MQHMTDNALMALHRLVRESADDLTEGVASATRDLDAYLLALMHAVLGSKVPCDLDTLKLLHGMASAEGFE